MTASSSPSAAAERAFPSHPRVDRYFATEANRAHRQRLVELLERGDGPGLVIGAPGVGKTMLMQAIAAELMPSLRVVSLACTQLCTRRALLQAILRGLELPFGAREEGQLRLGLIDGLERAEGPVALLVDEAQSLPARLLEELRMLGNIASTDGGPRVRLLLAGTPTLDEALTAPELASLSQRIAARCYLAPLSYDDTAQYVRAHIGAAGGDPDTLLTSDAYQALFAATDGVPRLINQLGDRALVLAVERGEAAISADAIQAAWSDLNQLPAPWHTPASTETTGGREAAATASETSVEFGPLDDLDDLNDLDALGGSEHSTACDPTPTAEALAETLEDGTELDEPEVDEHAFDEPTLDTAGTDSLISPPMACELEPTRDAVGSVAMNAAAQVNGVWNADAGLPIAARLATASTESADECVSLAFPGVKAIAASPGADPLPVVPQPKDADDESPLADDPFDESFDEEEVVIDRFADLTAVTPSDAMPVVNHQDIEFGKLFEGLDPAVESLVAQVEAQEQADDVGFRVLQAVAPVDRPAEPTPTELTAADTPKTEAAASATADPIALEADETSADNGEGDGVGPMLVIDDDSPAKSSVERREYDQLFASLRQG
ncbi:MAG: AAA family ATPase [Planctomycetota bacterium]